MQKFRRLRGPFGNLAVLVAQGRLRTEPRAEILSEAKDLFS
jgi:hypothetical protein